MTSKLDVFAMFATRLGEARDSGKIKPENDRLTCIKVENNEGNQFDIIIQMERRATLIIQTLELDESTFLTTQKMVKFLWPHKDDSPMKPSRNAGEAPLYVTFYYKDNLSDYLLFSATKYLIDAWLDDTNPAHMWTNWREENND